MKRSSETNIRDLFDQFEVFTLTNRTHRVYLDPDTCLTFTNLNNALNAYSANRHRALIEDIGNESYLVYSNTLSSGPVKVSSLNEALKLMGELL